MDVLKLIAELREEHRRVGGKILRLEKIAEERNLGVAFTVRLCGRQGEIEEHLLLCAACRTECNDVDEHAKTSRSPMKSTIYRSAGWYKSCIRKVRYSGVLMAIP
jgi:hypothetical protein